MIRSRPYEGPHDLRAVQAVAQGAWRRDRRTVDVGGTVGELAWSLGGLVPDDVWTGRVWFRQDTPVAYATLQRAPDVIVRPGEREQRPDTLDWQLDCDDAELLTRVLEWGESEASGDVATSARPAHATAVSVLEGRGYVADDSAPWNLLNIRPLDEIEDPVLPAGFGFKTMTDVGDVDARVALHRASWDGSRMTTARYEDVMGTWPYDPSLDCVVAAPDGSLVASALAWFDPDAGLGELEPVGTHRDFRRRGLGRAVNLFALGRLRHAGAGEAIVACRGDDDYPVPRKLYTSVGFRELSRQVPYLKTVR